MNIAERNAKTIAAIDDYTRRACATPATARATLVREGIYLQDGQLTPQYGGEPSDLAVDQNPDTSDQLRK